MRKKNFIESLKESVKLLSDERDKVDRDRRISLSRLAEQVGDYYGKQIALLFSGYVIL